jgi:hypothetical protein
MPQPGQLVADFPPWRPGLDPRSSHVGFVVEKVTLGQVFSEYFGFGCQFSFHRLLHTHHLSSGVGTIGQLVAYVPSGLSLTPPPETKKGFQHNQICLSRLRITGCRDGRTRHDPCGIWIWCLTALDDISAICWLLGLIASSTCLGNKRCTCWTSFVLCALTPHRLCATSSIY